MRHFSHHDGTSRLVICTGKNKATHLGVWVVTAQHGLCQKRVEEESISIPGVPRLHRM